MDCKECVKQLLHTHTAVWSTTFPLYSTHISSPITSFTVYTSLYSTFFFSPVNTPYPSYNNHPGTTTHSPLKNAK